jgi:cell division septation protein DedD
VDVRDAGLTRRTGARRFFGVLALVLLRAFLPGPPLHAQSLGAEVQNIEKTLESPGLSVAERRDALVRLARLRELSGDLEGAARHWGDAAAVEPGKPDDLSLIRGAWCLAAMGEWDRAESAVKTVLLAGRPGPALLKARYLGALIEALGAANYSALETLAASPGLDALRPPAYYALWKLLGPAGASWKARLLAEFPRSPEARIAASEDAGAGEIGAAPAPMWLLFPGRDAVALSYPAAAPGSAPPAPAAPRQPGSAPPSPAAPRQPGSAPPPPAAPSQPGSAQPAPAARQAVLLQTGLFSSEGNAQKQADRLRTAGFSPLITRRTVNGTEYWAAGVSPGQDLSQMTLRLKDAGFESFPVF